MKGKIKLKDAVEYVNVVVQDGLSVAVFWKYVKRYGQLPPHHRSFDGEHFIECLKVVMDKIGTSKVRKGGTKSKPATPKPNIRPAGQKPVRRPITYNSRIVGPQ